MSNEQHVGASVTKKSRKKKPKPGVWFLCTITHIATGKAYVGYTSQYPEDRWKQHVSNAKSNRGKGRWYMRTGLKRSEISIVKGIATRKARGIKGPGSTENTKKGWITRRLNIERKALLLSMGFCQETMLDG